MHIRDFLPLRLVDIVLPPFVYVAGWLLKCIRRIGVHNLPNCKNTLMNVGVFPIQEHYYEPQFNHRLSQKPFSHDRNLTGINWNINEQLENLENLVFTDELGGIQDRPSNTIEFHFNNGSFESGDAEYWYQIIRAKKPKRIFEIGSGNSTLMALKAIQKNQEDSSHYKCHHICIEPYEMPWLEKEGVQVLREKIENIDPSFFSELESDDILFIDSSHIIRPQGDVLFEYLEILPILKPGVIVHIHDIFSPKNYLDEWLKNRVLFWNEQYLLEAFLTHNSNWKILGALNQLHHNYYEKLKSIAPYLTPDREPGSFYIQKIF